MEPAKLLLPYLQRADELHKHEPLVAYYCRLYAMERGLKIPAQERTKTTNAVLVSLMNQLEKDKKSISLVPEDNLYIEGFALNVFTKADKQDRAGHADLNTAKTFYAASIFFEILHQFGELQPDIEQKQKYAVWKAADIRKMLSEGKKPQPGPPSSNEELSFTTEVQDVQDVPVTSSGTKGTKQADSPVEMSENTSMVLTAGGDFSSSAAAKWQDNLDATNASFTSSHLIQPLRGSSSQYQALFSDSNYTQMPDRSVIPPTGVTSLYGSGTSSEGPDIQQIHDSHHSYTSPFHLGDMHSQPPLPTYSTSFTENTASDTSYYQNSHYSGAPPYASNPNATTYLSPQYGLYPSGQDVTAYNDSIPIERTISAPAMYEKSSGSVKGMENRAYQPPPEKIAEAHKASRFAVSALAFDDVPTAVSFLERALELLINPSASVH